MNFNKRKMMRCADVVFWVIIIANAIMKFRALLIEGNVGFEGLNTEVMKYFEMKNYFTLMCSLGLMFLFLIVMSQLNLFYLTIPYIGIKIAYRKFNKERLDKIDFKNDHYYREIISEYSPAVLSYIDDFKLEEKDVVATVMSLELKGKIKIEDKIKVINNEEEDLEENEKYVLYHIKKDKLKNMNGMDFEESVIRDCKKDGVLEEKSDIKKKIIKNIIIGVFINILIISSIAFFMNDIVDKVLGDNVLSIMAIMLIVFLGVMLFPFVITVYTISYLSMNVSKPYVRNRRGKEINTKLEGLKKYIKEYSLLDEKKYDDLNMWEDYLIYSVMFGQNDTIVKEIMKKSE